MKTKIEWAELHAPLFLAGTNLGLKLDAGPKATRQGLTLEYDEDKRHLYASYNGKVARIPETSVLSMVEGTTRVHEVFREGPALASAQIAGIDAAQVSSPMHHVHAGAGHGQTGQDFKQHPSQLTMNEQAEAERAAVRRKPGRPPRATI